MFSQEYSIQRRIFLYGLDGAYHEGHLFGVLYRGEEREECSPENRWIFYAISGNANNLVTCLYSTPTLEQYNTINTVTSTYRDSMNHENTNSYINNEAATVIARIGSLNTQPANLMIGQNMPYSTFLSLRLYDRVLNPGEIATNAALDQKRYLAPPTVTVGGTPCTDVVVLSSHFLMCTVPPGTAGTKNNVVVVSNGKTYTYNNAYGYVGSSDFYVDKIEPIIGKANDVLTLTGNRLDDIDDLKVGGISRSPSTPPTSGSYQCTLPSGPTGEVDITITLKNNGGTYRFAKVFEYQ
jgi:hypothetical protein